MRGRTGMSLLLGVLLLSGVAACVAVPAVGPTAGAAPTSPTTPTAPAGELRFTAAGDYGATDDTGSVLETIRASDPDVHFALGDLSYGRPGEEDQWCRFVTDRVGPDLPFQLLPGNHESDGSNGAIAAFAECLPNRLPGLVGSYPGQYYVDLPQGAPLVRFVMISPAITFPDGTWTYTAGSDRFAWTAAAIDGARSAGVPWVVVGMHKPCLSTGVHSCDVGPDLLHLLVSERVDLVISGHEHMYERTRQLDEGPGCPRITIGSFTPACVADADDALVAGAGTVFVTVGTGGTALRSTRRADAEAPYFAAVSAANADPTHGVLDARATPTELRLSFRRATGGTFTDAVAITRSGAPWALVPADFVAGRTVP
ncbi:metallophosphoesterase [Humibacillus xanthopallidus]|uniref:metallophosphoesterase n=1 Tax=Humibacillus xanthopallidus TaxID=412689 RepID=UPI00384DF5ED